MQSVFLTILASYGVLCGGITLLSIFPNANFDELIDYVNSYDSRLVSGLYLWHRGLLRDFSSCRGALQCASDISLHTVNLFFLFTYIPIFAMFIAFVANNPTVKRTLFGEQRGDVAEMPALEHADGAQQPASKSSGCRRRTSSKSGKQIEPQLIYDDTFGIIRKDILDSWNRPARKLHVDTSDPSDGAGKAPMKSPLPPIRVMTPTPTPKPTSKKKKKVI